MTDKGFGSYEKTLEFENALNEAVREVQGMLLEKNRRYGNSALNPIQIFSKLKPEEAINARIDDKLSRLRTLAPGETEDVELDLLGYLLLKRTQRVLNRKVEL